MPNIPDAISLKNVNKDLDRRRKLNDEQREHIKKLHSQKMPIREIARQYEAFISRRGIQFILFPERDLKLKKQVKLEKRWLKYYNKENHTNAIRSLRAYKRKVLDLPYFPEMHHPKKTIC